MSNATNNTDVGRDVEHVESLLQKLELLRNKLCGHEKTVKNLQEKANSLIEGGHTESTKVKNLLVELEDAWFECVYSAETRFKTLEQAKLIHSFKKSADETISWIYEKDVALSSENYGHDLQSIETLLRHHETLERDLKAIQEQVHALHVEATTLSEQFLDSRDTLEEKYTDVTDAYERCSKKAIERKEKLLQAEQMQSYFDEARDFQAWIREMSAMITQVDLPQDVAACEAVLAHHDGYKSEIDSQIQSFRRFENEGQEIIISGHFMAPDIQEKLQNLNSSFENLLSLWQDKRRAHEQNLDLQLFKKKVKELDNWLQGQEYYLCKEDGRSLEEVDYLIRKHETLEQKLNLYEAKFQELLKTTKIEQEIMSKKEGEEQKRNEDVKLEEQRKLEDIKRKEEERLLEVRRQERVQLEMSREPISDDDFHPPNDLPIKEQIFKRYDSRRSFPDRNQHQIASRPRTPVINRKLTVSMTVVPPTTAEGFLQRKQETLSGGKRSTSRSWKTYYTVLCGQLMCFFKDKKSFTEKNAAKPPINILGASCTLPRDYRKKLFVFRLGPTDGSSFLFNAHNNIKRDEWFKKINYTSALPPSMQLMSEADERNTVITTSRKDSTEILKDRGNSTDSNEQDEPPIKRTERFSFTDDVLYENIPANIDAISNPIYAIPRSESVRSDTLTYDDDDNLHSARSSFSNQSYRTAIASSSVSTLQDEHTESSEEEMIYSLPEPLSRTKSEISLDTEKHEKAKKQMSLPRDVPTKSKEGKRRWNVFSLRRKQ